MKCYELTYILSPKLTGEEIKKFSEKIGSFIQEKKGILLEISQIKEGITKGKLAILIKKETQGYLNTLNFYLDPQLIEELKTKLNSESQILRYIILIKKAKKEVKIPPELPKMPKIEKAVKPLPEKVDLKEIEKKLEEILEE